MTTRDKNLMLNFIRQSAVGKPISEMRDKIFNITKDLCDKLDAINQPDIKSKVTELEDLIFDFEYLLEHTYMDCGALTQSILDDAKLDNLPKDYWGGGNS